MRLRVPVMVVLAGGTVLLGVLESLAANAATGTETWPGPLALLRQYPWRALAGLAALTAGVAAVVAYWQERPAAVVRGDPPPPPTPVVLPWMVDRGQVRDAVSAVCGDRRTVGVTTSLWGAGGFGKTTLATLVGAHPRVQRRFRTRVYVVTIGRDLRGRAAIAAKVAETTRYVTGDTQEFEDPDHAGAHLGRLLDERPRTLLVLDDVWESEQLAPFLRGGRPCVRLITTRVPDLLPAGAHTIQVDAMSHAQAMKVLTWELPSPLPQDLAEDLLRVTGRWALLLRLANRVIADQTATGADTTHAATTLLQQLRTQGPSGVDSPDGVLDLDDPTRRSQAVRATVEAATTRLPANSVRRYAELAIFAEDEAVPLELVARLWQATDTLTEEQSRALCLDLQRFSLLTLTRENGGLITLHDVLRDYLRAELGASELTSLNATLIDTVAARLSPAGPLAASAPAPGFAWWEVDGGYLLDHLIEHLLAAGRTDQAETVATDLRWVEARLAQRGPTAPWSDLTLIPTPAAAAHARPLAQAAHLLTPSYAMTNTLHNRLEPLPAWHDQVIARQQDPALGPRLINEWSPPDIPHPALRRAIAADSNSVLVISPNGTWLATAGSDDGTVRIWDPATGTCTTVLEGHSGKVLSVAVSPDGTWLASACIDGTVRIWDRATETCTNVHRMTTSLGSSSVLSVAVVPSGVWLATAGLDGTVRIWAGDTGACTAVLEGHTSPVESVAVAPDGTWLATGSIDGTVRIWDPATRTCTAVLEGHRGKVLSVAVSPDGTWLATTGVDKTLRIWEPATNGRNVTLGHHAGPVTSVAVAPENAWLATVSVDGTLRIWDLATVTCTAILGAHTGPVWSVAVAPDGTWLATAGINGAVRIWDVDEARASSSYNTGLHQSTSVAVSPDGTWLASACIDGTVRTYERDTGTCTAFLDGYAGPVWSMAMAPDGTWLASGTINGTVLIWDPATETRTAVLEGHTDLVTSVAIARDGTWLASGSHDGTVRIWDPATGTCTAFLEDHAGPVESVAVAPDGTWLATTGSRDGTVQIWDVSEGRVATALRFDWPLAECTWATDGRSLAITGMGGLHLCLFHP